MRLLPYLLHVESLTEGGKGAAGYIGMFSDFIAGDAKAKLSIEKYIAWARQNLKKNDRIVWFLRWVRVELAGRAKHTDSDEELSRLNKRLGEQFDRQDLVPINNLMTNLTHYLGMPIPQMQAITWLKQSPSELLGAFSEIESDWKEANKNSKNLLSYQQDQEPKRIMAFPDGYAWFDLETPDCPDEARAMGHCGNAGGRGTILSLRRLAKTHEGRTYWYPVLTFILHRDGYLGEMKGRGNDKPTEKYHPYIVALLKDHPEIEGIRGGGYLPHHNFMMGDLDPDESAELKKLKPGLADIDDIYRKEGMTERVRRLISARLPAGLEIGVYDPDTKSFIVESWQTLAKFLSYGVYDVECEEILKIAVGEADFQADGRDENVEQKFVDTLLDLPPQWQEKAIARAGITSGRSSMDQAIIAAAQKLGQSNDDWYRTFREVHGSGSVVQEQAWERLAKYIEVSWSFASQQVYLNIPHELTELKEFVEGDTTVELRCVEQGMIDYAMAGQDDDDDDDAAWELRQMSGDGREPSWEALDSDHTEEQRREAKLYLSREDSRKQNKRNDQDTWLAGIDTTSRSLTSDFLNALQRNPSQQRINDPRQQEISFEARRLLALAGLQRL